MPKVLVAEDDTRVLQMVRQRLMLEGFGVLEAQDAQEAWRTLIDEAPDAAIVDITLRSERDGWRLIDSVREDGRFVRMPIVVMTGSADPDIEERAASQRCEFLAKPFSPEDMIETLRRAMGGVLQKIKVTILLAALRVEGTVHLTTEHSRFSDAWESLVADERSFIPVTEVTVAMPDGSNATEVPFLQVKKADILAVYPAEGN